MFKLLKNFIIYSGYGRLFKKLFIIMIAFVFDVLSLPCSLFFLAINIFLAKEKKEFIKVLFNLEYYLYYTFNIQKFLILIDTMKRRNRINE